MGYTGWTEPAPRCTVCHKREQRPHYQTCTDPDCQQIALMLTARDLQRVALAQSEHMSNDGDADTVIALVWITRQWRTAPMEPDEETLQRLVVQLLEQDCTAAELLTWREMNSEAVRSIVGGIASRHGAAARVVETLREAAAA